MGKARNSEYGEVVGILTGVGGSLLFCVGTVAGLAQLHLNQKAGEGSLGIIIAAILSLSTLLGSQLAARFKKKRAVILSAITTISFAALLFIMGMVMEGRFQNVWGNLAAVVTGGLISCVLCLKKLGKATRRKRFSR